jgi:hypothetical protein
MVVTGKATNVTWLRIGFNGALDCVSSQASVFMGLPPLRADQPSAVPAPTREKVVVQPTKPP